MYESARGVAEGFMKVAGLYQRAADSGNISAACNDGFCLSAGTMSRTTKRRLTNCTGALRTAAAQWRLVSFVIPFDRRCRRQPRNKGTGGSLGGEMCAESDDDREAVCSLLASAPRLRLHNLAGFSKVVPTQNDSVAGAIRG